MWVVDVPGNIYLKYGASLLPLDNSISEVELEVYHQRGQRPKVDNVQTVLRRGVSSASSGLLNGHDLGHFLARAGVGAS